MKYLILILLLTIYSCDNSSGNKTEQIISFGKWNAELIISENKTAEKYVGAYLFESIEMPYNNGIQIVNESELYYMFDKLPYEKPIKYTYENGFITFDKSNFKLTNISKISFDLIIDQGRTIRFRKF